jgi:hypothetical protein
MWFCRGVFQLLKYSSDGRAVEAQARLVFCRPAQSWTGGLTAKCTSGLAVRIDANTVLEASYSFDPDEGAFVGSRALLKNGVALAIPSTLAVGAVNITVKAPQRKRIAGFADTLLEQGHTIQAPDYAISISITECVFVATALGPSTARCCTHAIALRRFYMTFIFGLRTRAWFGSMPGICGGGGQAQYSPGRAAAPAPGASPPASTRVVAGSPAVSPGINGAPPVTIAGAPVTISGAAITDPIVQPITIGYPCQNCLLSLGQFGALCGCREFLLAPAAQLFQTKQTHEEWVTTNTSMESHMDQRVLQESKEVCKAALMASPQGRLALAIPALASLLDADLNNCAIDKEAGIATTSTTFNRAELDAAVCRQANVLLSQATPANDLCQIITACAAQGFHAAPASCQSAVPPPPRPVAAAGRRR